MAVAFPRDSVTTVNIIFAFVYPLPALYTLSFLSTLRARQSNSVQYEQDKLRSLNAALGPTPVSAASDEMSFPLSPPLGSSSPRAAARVEFGESGSAERRDSDLEKAEEREL